MLLTEAKSACGAGVDVANVLVNRPRPLAAALNSTTLQLVCSICAGIVPLVLGRQTVGLRHVACVLLAGCSLAV